MNMESHTGEGSFAGSSTDSQYSECVVCGCAKGTIHYGAITCQSCKIFFLRAVLTTVPLTCDKNNSCIYPADKCRSCRYLKCLAMGMIPNIVGLRDGCVKRKALETTEKTKSTPINISKALLPIDRKRFVNNTVAFFRDLTIEDIEDLAASMIRTERYCDNDHHDAFIDPQFRYNINLDLVDALRNPLLICERTPIGYTQTDPVRFDYAEAAQRIFCRQVLHFVDYFLACEDIWDMSLIDRMRLCSAQWSATVMCNIVYSTYKYRCDTLIFCSGYKYDNREGTPNDAYSNFIGFACELAHRNIISVFKELKVTEEEFAFLKKINFFTTSTRLSEKGSDTVRHARTKYEVAFAKYLNWKYPCTAATRLWKIMGTIPYLKILGDKNDKSTTRSVVLNTANLSANLPYDIHVREI